MLGLFQDPYRYLNMDRYKADIRTKEAQQMSREIAQECQVLLKNEGDVLPLKKSAKIALVGYIATSGKEMQGCWAFSVCRQLRDVPAGHARGCGWRGRLGEPTPRVAGCSKTGSANKIL